jgi:hypothetical protein
MTRNELLTRLEKLLPSQFEAVLFRANVPAAHLPGAGASQATRAQAAIRLFEQHDQLVRLGQILDDVVVEAFAAGSGSPAPVGRNAVTAEPVDWQVGRSDATAERADWQVGRSDATAEPVERRAIAKLVHVAMTLREADDELAGPLSIEGIEAEETRDGRLRRVESVKHELARSMDPLVLVEGPAGSGKSVLLRRMALELAQVAEAGPPPAPVRRGGVRGWRRRTLVASPTRIPLYVNLRDLGSAGTASANPRALVQQIRQLILDKWPEIPELAEVLDGRAHDGGRWLLLLDSFDEIPALLGSTDFDHVALCHARAIEKLAETCSSSCRVVVASRPYRSPVPRAWVRYRLLPLSGDRCLTIAQSCFLGDRDRAGRFLGDLQISRLTGWTDCPLILTVLCEDYRHRGKLPRSIHEAFESHVDRCLDRRGSVPGAPVDRPRLLDAAERLAFWMTADQAVGLTVEVPHAVEAMRASAPEIDLDVRTAMENLVAVGLARIGAASSRRPDRFAFRHRRLQDYFATCRVRGGEAVTPDELLTSERWRETAIALLQSGEAGRIAPLLLRAAELLEVCADPLRDLIAAREPASLDELEQLRREQVPIEFPWPGHSVHILGILHALSASWGDLDGALAAEADRARRAATAILVACAVRGVRDDVVVAIEHSGVALDPARDVLLSWACMTPSEWLDDTVFLEASALRATPTVVRHHVRYMLLRYAFAGQLGRRRVGIETQLQRIDGTGELRRAAWWLVAAEYFDAGLWGALGLLFVLGILVGGAEPVPMLSNSALWQCIWGPCAAFLCWSLTPRLLRGPLGVGLAGVAAVVYSIFLLGAFMVVNTVRQVMALLLVGTSWAIAPKLPAWLAALWIFGGLLLLLVVPARTCIWLFVRFGHLRRRYSFLLVSLVAVVPLPLLLKGYPLSVWLSSALEPYEPWNKVVGAMILCSIVAKLLWDWSYDRKLDWQLRRSSGAMDAEQVLTNARRFRLARHRASYLRWVRERRRFQPTAKCERMLRDAALTIERDQRLLLERAPWWWRRLGPTADLSWSAPFATWYQEAYRRRRGGMGQWSDASLDEIIRLRRQAASAPGIRARSLPSDVTAGTPRAELAI